MVPSSADMRRMLPPPRADEGSLNSFIGSMNPGVGEVQFIFYDASARALLWVKIYLKIDNSMTIQFMN